MGVLRGSMRFSVNTRHSVMPKMEIGFLPSEDSKVTITSFT